MSKMKKKNSPRQRATTPNSRLAVNFTSDGAVEINYNPSIPPHVFIDTNVLRGLGKKGIEALRLLQSRHGFQFRYSILNFIELVAHLGDPPSAESPDPFGKFQAPFKKIFELFRLDVLPSAEMVLMDATGLREYLDPKWIADPMDIGRQVAIIAKARSLDEVREYGINPSHYKHLKDVDCNSFEDMMRGAIGTLKRPLRVTNSSAKWLGDIYSFLIYRASSKRIRCLLYP